VVEKDAHLSIVVLLVAEGVLDFGLAAILRTGEVVVAHGDCDLTAHIDMVVVEDDV